VNSAEVSSRQNSVAYLVRSLRTYARIRSLTTGTFNLIVKDRTALRLSGAHSVQSECPCSPGRIRPGSSESSIPTEQNPTVLETLQTYRAAKTGVNAPPPQNFHQISTSGKRRRQGRASGSNQSPCGFPKNPSMWGAPLLAAFARSGSLDRLQSKNHPVERSSTNSLAKRTEGSKSGRARLQSCRSSRIHTSGLQPLRPPLTRATVWPSAPKAPNLSARLFKATRERKTEN